MSMTALKRLVATMNRSGPRSASDMMEQANALLGGFGVEAIRGEGAWDNYFGDAVGLYVNTGDTYNTTVVYDVVKNRAKIETMGDFVERNDRRYRII